MKTIIHLRRLIAASVLSAFALGAWAQTETPRIDKRQEQQQARIAQGAASGALTKRETRRLEREQMAIAQAKGTAQADGVVTAQEKKRLARMQNRASKDIKMQKHDAQTRPGTAPNV